MANNLRTEKTRSGCTFHKATLRNAQRAQVVNLCPVCKGEIPRQMDHTFPVAWSMDFSAEAIRWFEVELGRPEMDINDHMKSDDNLGRLCGRCHFDKTADERNAFDAGARLVVLWKWRLKSFTLSGKRRPIKTEIGQKVKHTARAIGKQERDMKYWAESGNKNMRLDAAKKRAKLRRKVRGKVEWK
jgi:hypothetical protein